MPKTIAPWTASYDPALAVRAYESVTPGDVDPDNPGWRWVTAASGLGGWVPDQLLAGARVLHDFDTRELTAPQGADVQILERRIGWAWVVDTQGRSGWVPEHVFAEADLT